MQDTTNTPQDSQDKATAPVTFIVMKDGKWGGQPDVPDVVGTTAPVFQAYVDIGSEGYEHIDLDNYNAAHNVLQAFMDVNQPKDPAGVWWVGRVPDVEADLYTHMSLRRFTVRHVLTVDYS